MIEREYQRPMAKERSQVLAELAPFARSFCEAIGRGQFVDPVVNALDQTATLLESAPESI
jgi:hypothetical protein